jgi:uncharacterized RDD family membrane protein YckC
MAWQYMQDGEIRGPVSSEAFSEVLPSLSGETKVYQDGWKAWRKLKDLEASELPQKAVEAEAPLDESRSRPAEFWRRAAAFLLDYYLIKWPLDALLGGGPGLQHWSYAAPGQWYSSYSSVSDLGGGWLAGHFGWAFALTLVYETLLISRFGWTLGKFLFGIRVSHEGHKLDWRRSLLRVLAKKLNLFILMLGYLMALWDRDEMALHDHLLKTRVYLR